MRNNEHVEFFANIDDITVNNEASIPEVMPQVKVLQKVYKDEDDIYKRDAKAMETKYISGAHRSRRGAFMLLKRSIDAARYSDEPEHVEAVVRLNEVLHNYRSIPSAPMFETSALIRNMLEDLRKQRYDEAVKVLKLSSDVDKLEEKNEEFRAIYAERTHSTEVSEIKGTMGGIRPKVDRAFVNLLEAVNTYYTFNKLSGKIDQVNPYYSVIVLIDGFIEQAKRIYDRRTPGAYTSKPNKPGGSEDEDTETPVDSVPVLAVSSQEIKGSWSMLLVMADQKAFEEALYPDALHGTLVLSSPTVNDYPDFPIEEFEVKGGRPIGLVVSPPKGDLTFDRPLYSMGLATGDVIKDDKLLAVITGIEWPASTGGLREE
jgi:hypothetical protein